jgi:nicotinate-nucleotide adenylyltransferase
MIPSLMVDNTGTLETQIPRLDLIIRASKGLPANNGRLGVLGGVYNPITRAHLILTQAAVEQFNIDEVIFVLSKISPHKPLFGASIAQRLEMMRISIADIPFISIGLCTHGLFLDICEALQPHYPQNPELFFITGRDVAERIISWPYPDPGQAIVQMFETFQLLVFPRRGKLKLPENDLIRTHSHRIHNLQLPENLDHVSSTEVRQRVEAGLDIDNLVPVEVAAYIEAHNIYRPH